jgi:methionyl-tRNA formyltransferase
MPLQSRRGHSSPQFSCVVIGDAAITIRCAQLLVHRGDRILGIITSDGRVAAWSAEHDIRCRFEPPAAPVTTATVTDLAGEQPFDLLFSIHSVRLLGADVLSLPRRMGINYHDALLPRYAGLHATSWVILHGETCHGITWHRMTERVDGGDILLQRQVPVEPGDSAWTLSLRCAQVASDSFPDLLTDLAAGRLVPRPQQLAERFWFPGWRQPAAACVIPWRKPATEIASFVRALDFGAADNPMGSPKVLGPNGPLFVAAVEVLDRRHFTVSISQVEIEEGRTGA